MSSPEATTVDANRNRRETKSSPLNADNLIDQSNGKKSNIQEQTRESGDGASSAGPDVIENAVSVPPTSTDGRRVLSTARNGSLFDDDDDDDDVDTANSVNTNATTSSSIETKVNSTTNAE